VSSDISVEICWKRSSTSAIVVDGGGVGAGCLVCGGGGGDGRLRLEVDDEEVVGEGGIARPWPVDADGGASQEGGGGDTILSHLKLGRVEGSFAAPLLLAFHLPKEAKGQPRAYQWALSAKHSPASVRSLTYHRMVKDDSDVQKNMTHHVKEESKFRSW
jgi:hypothetical protein